MLPLLALFVPIVIVVVVVAATDVEIAGNTPCGGKGGGISSLSFRVVAGVTTVVVAVVVALLLGGIIADDLIADFAAKLFRATLSLLE